MLRNFVDSTDTRSGGIDLKMIIITSNIQRELNVAEKILDNFLLLTNYGSY